MKLLVTKNVIHKYNCGFMTLLVQFEPTDKHYFHKQQNWMPKEQELIDMVIIMSALKPQFKGQILRGMFP